MGRFLNKATGVTFSVADGKDDRYKADGFEPAKAEKPAPVRKADASKK